MSSFGKQRVGFSRKICIDFTWFRGFIPQVPVSSRWQMMSWQGSQKPGVWGFPHSLEDLALPAAEKKMLHHLDIHLNCTDLKSIFSGSHSTPG